MNRASERVFDKTLKKRFQVKQNHDEVKKKIGMMEITLN